METSIHGLEFPTSRGRVFTPPAATEALVDAALAHFEDAPTRAADVDAGAGAIAVALATRRRA